MGNCLSLRYKYLILALHGIKKQRQQQRQQWKNYYWIREELEGSRDYWLYLYNCVHLQYIQVCMCKRVIRVYYYK